MENVGRVRSEYSFNVLKEQRTASKKNHFKRNLKNGNCVQHARGCGCMWWKCVHSKWPMHDLQYNNHDHNDANML